jgi:hypothetical protein
MAAYAEGVARHAKTTTRMASCSRIVIFTEAFGPQVGGYKANEIKSRIKIKSKMGVTCR